MTAFKQKSSEQFIQLLEIMEKLRASCPWDKEQSHRTLIPYLIEETYEVIDAIEKKNTLHLREELGDLLFQIIFHSQIALEKNQFDMSGVLQDIIDKLTRRHPHVFGNTKVKDAQEVIHNWEQIKLAEKQQRGTSLLSEIPASLPGLLKAYKLGKKVSKVGFDWPDLAGVLAKVQEEIQELEESIQTKKQDEIVKMNQPHSGGEGEALSALPMEGVTQAPIIEEMGDLFFSLVNLSRHLKINPEEALRQSNEKFIRRFEFVEKKLQEQKKTFQETSLEEMDTLWNEAKKQSTKTV